VLRGGEVRALTGQGVLPCTSAEESAAREAAKAARAVAFLWQIAGRPADAAPDWRHARPLVIALDNYSVQTSQTVAAARPLLADAFCLCG
jgi:hypothetical protein